MPDVLKTALTAVVLGAVALQLTRLTHHTLVNDRSTYRRVLAALRWRMLPAAVGHVTVVGVVFALLYGLPGLSWGWWGSVSGSESNALAGQSDQTGAGFVAASFVIPLLLAVVVPRVALAEEEIFRAGAQHRSRLRLTGSAVGFGLVHCLVGVPLAAGLALVVSGLVYTRVYLAGYRRTGGRLVARDALLASRVPWATLDPAGGHRLVGGPLLAEARDRAAEQDALYRAAAFHTASNWLLLTLLLLTLTLTHTIG